MLGRNTQGVRLIKLSQKDERLVGVERIEEGAAVDDDLDEVIEGEVDGDVVSGEGEGPSSEETIQ